MKLHNCYIYRFKLQESLSRYTMNFRMSEQFMRKKYQDLLIKQDSFINKLPIKF